MIGVGITLQWSDFIKVFSHPKAVIIGLIGQLILLPSMAFLLLHWFRPEPEIAMGIMIIALCPGGSVSNLIALLAKADLALSVSLTAINSIITLFTIPLLINVALRYYMGEGRYIRLDVVDSLIKMIGIVLLPVSIGMAIRRFKPLLALKISKLVPLATIMVLVMVVAILIYRENEQLPTYFRQSGILALLLNLSSICMGYLLAQLFRVREKRAISLAIEVGVQNATLAITLAVVLLANPRFAIGAIIYGLLMLGSGFLIVIYGKWQHGRSVNA